MSKDFFESPLCKSGKSCRKCRLSRSYRVGITRTFDDVEDPDFECPYGRTAAEFEVEEEMPPIYQRVRNLVTDIAKTGRAAARGERVMADDAESSRRLAICSGTETTPKCDFFKNNQKCLKCGCNMNIKVRMKLTKCPIGKWGD